MPDIQLIKLTIRRGTDQQRQSVVLEQGELGFTTDHKRLWIGDGVLSGGHIIGAKIHTPITSGKTSLTTATKGDVVYENSLLFQLTGSNYSLSADWGNISTKPDLSYIQLDDNNKLTLVENSIDNNKFAPSAAYNAGGIKATTSYGLSVITDNTTIEISDNAVQIKDNGVNENKIISSALNKGLLGGSGTVIEVDADPTYFGFIGTTLTLSAIPPKSVTFTTINPDIIGDGLIYDGGSNTIAAYISGINATLDNTSGVIGLATVGTGETSNWAQITKDQYGRVTNIVSSLVSALTCNTTSDVVSAFNGFPNQVVDGNPGLTLTIFDCTSTNGTAFETVSLSSAGFIVIPGATTQDGLPVGRIAIPVFTL